MPSQSLSTSALCWPKSGEGLSRAGLPSTRTGRHPDTADQRHGLFVSVLAAAGLSAAEIIPIDSLTAQKRMVEAGFGLALLPKSGVDD